MNKVAENGTNKKKTGTQGEENSRITNATVGQWGTEVQRSIVPYDVRSCRNEFVGVNLVTGLVLHTCVFV